MPKATSRGNIIGRALDAILFTERSSFVTARTLARELEINERSALNWIWALEARGVIIRDGSVKEHITGPPMAVYKGRKCPGLNLGP